MQLTLVDFDAPAFYPFSETRAISDLSTVGGTAAQLWAKFLPEAVISYCCAEPLSGLYSQLESDATVYIDSRVVPNRLLAEQVKALNFGVALVNKEGFVIALHTNALSSEKLLCEKRLTLSENYGTECANFSTVILESANDLFLKLGPCFEQLELKDFEVYTESKPGVIVLGDQLFVHPKATIQPGFYDTTSGPIIVEEHAEVSLGAMLKGPIYVGESAVVKMGAKIYGPSAIGTQCRVGGEVSNCNIGSYSNKGHDGFIGNAAIGEWCNLGADTNCSNLKNNYSKVKQYQHGSQSIEPTDMQFCGVLMGDHSKTAINTQINTASVFGAFSNTVSSTFPPKHLPNFSWYTDKGLTKFDLAKAYEMAEAMMARRNVRLTDETKALWRFLAQ